MKVLTSSQIKAADAFTIIHEPVTSIDLMERASIACSTKILELFPENTHFSIFCGTGNNGGDGLAIARLLAAQNKQIDVYLVHFSNQRSPENQQNLERLNGISNVAINDIRSIEDFKSIKVAPVIIDALVGPDIYRDGLTRPLTGLLKDVVQWINNTNSKRVAIDLPSGLYAESDNSGNTDAIIKSDYTVSFEVPKLSFFLPSLHEFIGEWILIPIGLDKEFILSQETDYIMLDENLISSFLKKRVAFSHKGTFGHGLIVAGSYGKIGAAVLSSKACLKAGAGLVTAFIPECGYEVLQTSVPEVMVETGETEDSVSGAIPKGNYSAIGIGPGIGTSIGVLEVLKNVIKHQNLVLDADALNLIGENKELLARLPKGAILTPHLKEFERMFGESSSDFDRLMVQRKASIELGVYIVLKGKNSSVSCPDGKVYFNSTGNPGMATAGSGDVLTGIITGLLCQGYTAFQSALLGVYLHGLAGDLAKNEDGEEAMTASDIIENLGKAFLTLHNY